MFPVSTTYFSVAQPCEPHHHRDHSTAEMGRRAFRDAYSHDNNPRVVIMQQPQLVSRTVYTERPVIMAPQQPMMMSQQPMMMSQQPMMMSQQPMMMPQQPMMMPQQPMMMSQQPMLMSQPTVVVQQPMMQSHHSSYSRPRNCW